MLLKEVLIELGCACVKLYVIIQVSQSTIKPRSIDTLRCLIIYLFIAYIMLTTYLNTDFPYSNEPAQVNFKGVVYIRSSKSDQSYQTLNEEIN